MVMVRSDNLYVICGALNCPLQNTNLFKSKFYNSVGINVKSSRGGQFKTPSGSHGER